MKNHYLLILIVALVIQFFGCQPKEKVVIANAVSIIPKPIDAKVYEGHFSINSETTLSVPESSGIENLLKDYLDKISIPYSKDEVSSDENYIKFELNRNDTIPEEGYRLVIDEGGILIKSAGEPGLFYGMQSLIQLISSQGSSLPLMDVVDFPRFGYRGMHLDVARHMFPVKFIKKYIDMMAHFKFNTFHWHLTEDQGWRIEIKKYPKLQEVASYRDETVVGHANTRSRGSETFDGNRYGGYYSQEEVKEVVAYAAERQITVIPEIELPGHSNAALAAYPHLGCTKGPYHTAKTWGVFDDIYCAGEESTFEFLEDVFDEVLPLFPGKYVHIGGDEAPKTQWEKCPACQKRIKDEGLEDEHELQSYFVQRMEKYLNSKGKTIIGWDEILEGGLAPNAVVMSWRGEEGGIEAAKQGHEVIMTPVGWCYLDYYQADPESEPLAIGGMITVEKIYGYEPIPNELSEEQHDFVLGAQVNLWSEYINTGEYAEYMMYPRAIAMSEVLWTPAIDKDYEDFISRLNTIQPVLDQMDINYAPHVFTLKKN